MKGGLNKYSACPRVGMFTMNLAISPNIDVAEDFLWETGVLPPKMSCGWSFKTLRNVPYQLYVAEQEGWEDYFSCGNQFTPWTTRSDYFWYLILKYFPQMYDTFACFPDEIHFVISRSYFSAFQVLCVISLSSLMFATLPNLASSANLITISTFYVTWLVVLKCYWISLEFNTVSANFPRGSSLKSFVLGGLCMVSVNDTVDVHKTTQQKLLTSINAFFALNDFICRHLKGVKQHN